MRLLLDTQVALWWLVASPRLGRSSRNLIAGAASFLSVASLWEVAIKHRLGKLPVPPQRFRDELVDGGATLLPITEAHAISTTFIPDGHSDPFDCLLLAVAQVEGLVLLTADMPLLRFAQANAIPSQSPGAC